MPRFAILIAALFVLITPAPSRALFHLAHISEMISGVNGDPSVQYVEIRMNNAFMQNAVGNTRLTAFNCDGTSSSVLLLVPSNVTQFGLDARWLMATTNFAAAAGITPDFTWNPAVSGSIDPTCGMVCWGAPGFIPPAPGNWSATDQNNYVDCVGYGGYTGPTKTSIHDGTPTSGTPTTLNAGNGTSSLTRIGFAGNNTADFMLAAPTPTNNVGMTGFGSGTTTTTLTGASTTTTTAAPGACADIAACRTGLTNVLPSVANAPSAKARKVASKLGKLSTRAGNALDKAATFTGKKKQKLNKKARAALTKLLAKARAADAAGTLGVSLPPLEGAVSALLAQIP